MNGRSIAEFTALPVTRAIEAVQHIRLNAREQALAGRIVKEVAERLRSVLTLEGVLLFDELPG